MPSKQSQSKAQPAQNNNNNSNTNNSNNTDTIKHLKDIKYWILEWASTHYLPHFITALSEDESEGFKHFLSTTDENVRNRVLLSLVPSMAGSTRTDDNLHGAINAFRGSAPVNHEHYGEIMAHLKLYVFIDELEAREITRKSEALKLWKQIYEPADTDKDANMNHLVVREFNSFDATSRKRIIDRFVEDFELRHFIVRLEEFVKDVLKSEFDTPILDQIAKDVNKGDYFPLGNVSAAELRAAFEGTEQQWQNIFKQKEKNVKDYIKKLQEPRPKPTIASPEEPVPAPAQAPTTPHTTPKNLQAQKFSKSAAVSGQQRPLAIKVNNKPIEPVDEPAPIVQPKAKQGKPRLDKAVTEKIRTLRDESHKLLAHGEDPLPRALADADVIKKPRRNSTATVPAARSRSPSPRPSPKPSQSSQPQDSGKSKSAPSSTVKQQPAEQKVQPKRKRSSETQGTTIHWESDEDFQPEDEEEDEEAITLKSPQTLKDFRIISQQKRGVKHTGQRRRRRWNEQETLTLIRGIMDFGLGSWSVICKAYEFEDRTPVDLKDRYRTITSTDDKMAQFNSIVEKLKAEKLEKRMKQKQMQQKRNQNNNADEDEEVDIEHYDEEEEEVEDIEEDEEEEQSLQHKKKKTSQS